MLIDSHSHIYLKEFNDDRQKVIDNAISNGVEKIILPNIDSSSIFDMNYTYNINTELFEMAIGLHPTSVKSDYKKELDLVFKNFNDKKYIAIGEIGIDLYWDKTFVTQQKDAFDFQLALALKYNLPVIIHSRESFDEIIDVLKPYFKKGITGVFHCFPGDVEQAKLVVENGFYIGIGGVLTYKKSNMPDVVKKIPLEYIILETDAPYLSPVPKRGKRNEPAYLIHIAEALSNIIEVDYNKVCKQTTDNSKKLFKL